MIDDEPHWMKVFVAVGIAVTVAFLIAMVWPS